MKEASTIEMYAQSPQLSKDVMTRLQRQNRSLAQQLKDAQFRIVELQSRVKELEKANAEVLTVIQQFLRNA